MLITFCGAAQEVTGSCYHLKTKNSQFLVDCGLFQGSLFAEEKNRDDFPFDPKKVGFLILTHAHLDHSGRLPLLFERGFRGKIFCTKATAQLTMIVLEDAVRIMAESAEDEAIPPLYLEQHVNAVRNHFERLDYHQVFEPIPGLKLEFFDAGHILGSAFVKVTSENKRIVFSGDLGNPPIHLLRNTEDFDQADTVIIESTYGGRQHESRRNSEAKFYAEIKKSISQKGVLLIPSFAIERTQEILFDLNNMIEAGRLPKFAIFLDSPMAIRTTEVFRKYPDCYNFEALRHLAAKDDLFDFPGLHLTETKNESKMINDYPAPKLIIAGSGMMHGGRIRHHLLRYLDQPSTSLIIIGYQVPGTLGRQIRDGARKVKLFGQQIQVRAKITTIEGFSAHADQPKLLNWLVRAKNKPEQVMITHGEINSQLALSEAIENTLRITTHIPKFGDKLEL